MFVFSAHGIMILYKSEIQESEAVEEVSQENFDLSTESSSLQLLAAPIEPVNEMDNRKGTTSNTKEQKERKIPDAYSPNPPIDKM